MHVLLPSRKAVSYTRQLKNPLSEAKETYDEASAIVTEVGGFLAPLLALFKGKT